MELTVVTTETVIIAFINARRHNLIHTWFVGAGVKRIRSVQLGHIDCNSNPKYRIFSPSFVEKTILRISFVFRLAR